MAGRPVRRALGFLLGFLALFFLASVSVSLLGGVGVGAGILGGDRAVALLPLEGEIATSDEFVETVEEVGEDESIGAVVVRIDSPGGQVAPSQEMYAALRKLRQTKPVIASLGSVAASGGYYVASAADVVVASPGTLTGSIGVIMMMPNVSGLLEKLGIEARILTAGSKKDMGTPFRPLTEEERKILQGMADQVHTQFIRAVAEGRGLDLERARSVSDGRIMTGEQAKEAGLVDELGGLEAAIAIAAERAGIEGEPRVERRAPLRRPWWWRALFSEEASVPPVSSLGAFLQGVATLLGEQPQTSPLSKPPTPELVAPQIPQLLWRLPFASEGLRW
jgi:protease-4